MIIDETWIAYRNQESRRRSSLTGKLVAIERGLKQLAFSKLNAETMLAYDEQEAEIIFAVTFGTPSNRYVTTIPVAEIVHRPATLMDRIIDSHIRFLFNEIVGEVLS